LRIGQHIALALHRSRQRVAAVGECALANRRDASGFAAANAVSACETHRTLPRQGTRGRAAVGRDIAEASRCRIAVDRAGPSFHLEQSHMANALPLIGLLLLGGIEPGSDTGRFRIEGEVRSVAPSNDGRFALSAQAHYQPQLATPDARFALKSTQAVCTPLADGVFANGFENP
jgi:hypothetical protein